MPYAADDRHALVGEAEPEVGGHVLAVRRSGPGSHQGDAALGQVAEAVWTPDEKRPGRRHPAAALLEPEGKALLRPLGISRADDAAAALVEDAAVVFRVVAGQPAQNTREGLGRHAWEPTAGRQLAQGSLRTLLGDRARNGDSAGLAEPAECPPGLPLRFVHAPE
jgi:hypothetical protein